MEIIVVSFDQCCILAVRRALSGHDRHTRIQLHHILSVALGRPVGYMVALFLLHRLHRHRSVTTTLLKLIKTLSVTWWSCSYCTVSIGIGQPPQLFSSSSTPCLNPSRAVAIAYRRTPMGDAPSVIVCGSNLISIFAKCGYRDSTPTSCT